MVRTSGRWEHSSARVGPRNKSWIYVVMCSPTPGILLELAGAAPKRPPPEAAAPDAGAAPKRLPGTSRNQVDHGGMGNSTLVDANVNLHEPAGVRTSILMDNRPVG